MKKPKRKKISPVNTPKNKSLLPEDYPGKKLPCYITNDFFGLVFKFDPKHKLKT